MRDCLKSNDGRILWYFITVEIGKFLPFDRCTANGLETCEIDVGGIGAGG
jgi:hypothetical protein